MRTAKACRGLLAGLSVALWASAAGAAGSAGVVPADGSHVYIVTAHGAAAEPDVISTIGIQAAIDACSADRGGTVLVPRGQFRTGTLHLRSGVELHIARGAVLRASLSEADYDGRRLIWAQGCSDIAITGPGVIDGEGPSFPHGTLRPHLIDLYDCENVALSSVTLRNSPAWTVHLLRCRHVRADGVVIENDVNRTNSDGINPDGCRDVRISDCYIQTGDDSIAVKCTADAGPENPTEGVTVGNCVLVTRKTALKIGTETHGDIRDCVFSNITILGSSRGIGIWMRDGATIERLAFSNITMSLQEFDGEDKSGEPIRITLDRRRPESPLGRVRDIRISDLAVDTPWRSLLAGHPERPLEHITVEGMTVRQHAPADKPAEWSVFDCRNIDGLRLRDVRVDRAEDDAPGWASVVRAEDVRGLSVLGLVGRSGRPTVGEWGTVVDIINCRGALIDQCAALPGTHFFAVVRGAESRGIVLGRNNLAPARWNVHTATEVPEGAVTTAGPAPDESP